MTGLHPLVLVVDDYPDAGADTAWRALAAGCAGFLVKPTPVQDVVAELERLVAHAPPPGNVELAAP